MQEVTARIFTFAAFADEIDTSANNELLAGLTLATDCVRSGARPKYSAIAKQDLVEWVRLTAHMDRLCAE